MQFSLKKISNLFSVPITPILASIYPVLFLAAANWDQIKYRDIGRSLTFCILFGIVLLLVCRCLMQTWQKAAMLGTVLSIIFFSYGHIYQFIEIKKIALLQHQKITLGISFILAVISFWLLRKAKQVTSLLQYANLIITGFCLFSLIQIWPLITGFFSESFYRPEKPISTNLASADLPDVYLLILDGYPRDDVSKEVLKFDNSSFTNDLKAMGFYVAECSQSNYNYTKLSIESMLNLKYINEVPDNSNSLQARLTNKNLVYNLKHSKFRKKLESLGYNTVAFETGYAFTEVADSTFYYPINTDKLIPNKFESIFINTTILYARYDLDTLLSGTVYKENARNKELEKNYLIYSYELNQNAMKNLRKSVNDIKGPKFVFAHLMLTHYPFVMKPDGSMNDRNVYDTKSLARQFPLINSYLLNLVKAIQSDKQRPSIIIIMGDHGYRLFDRIILQNYLSVYAPPEVNRRMYPTITPINLFRIIMTEVYGEDYPLVDDKSFTTATGGGSILTEHINTCEAK